MNPRLVLCIAVLASAATAACLGPQVPDKPGASANLLPAGTHVPDVTDSPDLVNELTLNDGLDSDALADPAHLNIIVRGTGKSAGGDVRFWNFGKATQAPAPIYLFGTQVGGAFQPLDHLPLVEAIPGDYQYNPIHSIYRVVVTASYHQQLITTTAALADAIDLGLVEVPVSTGTFMCDPIVRPGLALEVDTMPGNVSVTVAPTKVYGRGHVLDSFPVGLEFGPQPNPYGLLPTSQVSFLRDPRGAGFDATRPIFQATVPTAAPPPMMPNYTPLSVEVDVDLSSGSAAGITADGQLFTRDDTGSITMTSADVGHFEVTGRSSLLQLQFRKGMP